MFSLAPPFDLFCLLGPGCVVMATLSIEDVWMISKIPVQCSCLVGYSW